MKFNEDHDLDTSQVDDRRPRRSPSDQVMLTGMIDLLNNSGAALLVQGRMLAAGERAEGFEDTSSVRRLARLNVITIVSTPEKTTPHNPPQEDQP